MAATYVIAELAEGEQGGYEPRGAVKTLWQSRDFETMVSGPAETGKTWGCLQYVDALLWRYPGANGVMCRKTYAALVPAALQTYKRIIGTESPIRPYGGEKPEWFQYPNGSRLWCIGLDNPGKALSSERDFIYINQAEEVTLEDWETLSTRCTGRGAVMPYTRIFGDCNPGPPTHWIKTRQSLRLLESRHEDNPTLYAADGTLTEQGRISLGILDNLTGVRYFRLRKGLWVQAEGAVYENWDPAVHVIDRREIPESWARYWAVDFGYKNPFVWQAWAMDEDGRLYRYREIYFTGRLVEDHAKTILAVTEGEPQPRAIICDHDAEDRATLERHIGRTTEAASKSISPGIQSVAQRLNKAGDGRARIFYLRDSLVEVDRSLLAKSEPVCTEQEFEMYIWPPGVDGKPIKEVPVDKFNHGLDATRYAVAKFDAPLPPKEVAYSPVGIIGGFKRVNGLQSKR
jgi:hypothetical protein